MRYQWSPTWWRDVTWPEFKTIVFMRNEADELEAKRDLEESGDDPAAAGLRDKRLGRPPAQAELDLLPRA